MDRARGWLPAPWRRGLESSLVSTSQEPGEQALGQRLILNPGTGPAGRVPRPGQGLTARLLEGQLCSWIPGGRAGRRQLFCPRFPEGPRLETWLFPRRLSVGGSLLLSSQLSWTHCCLGTAGLRVGALLWTWAFCTQDSSDGMRHSLSFCSAALKKAMWPVSPAGGQH